MKIKKLKIIHLERGKVTEVQFVNRMAEIRDKINEIIDALAEKKDE